MGVAQSVQVWTGTTMFRQQSVLLVCTCLAALASPQSYFHTTHGVGGSFTSVSHGHAGHQAAVVSAPVAAHHHHTKPSYGAPPAYCHEEIHETCALEPTLQPVVRPVTVSLPQPVEVCINKQIVLPYLECEK